MKANSKVGGATSNSAATMRTVVGRGFCRAALGIGPTAVGFCCRQSLTSEWRMGGGQTCDAKSQRGSAGASPYHQLPGYGSGILPEKVERASSRRRIGCRSAVSADRQGCLSYTTGWQPVLLQLQSLG